MRERCAICGKFLKRTAPYVWWVPYGGPLDTEPPDEERAHPECYGPLEKGPYWQGPAIYNPVTEAETYP